MERCTGRSLLALGRESPTPFLLAIRAAGAGQELRIDRVLRLVPGRRLTALATWNDTVVIAKLFPGKARAGRRLARDANGMELLRQHGIATPEILGRAVSTDGCAAILLIEYLQQAQNLGHLFEQTAHDEQRQRLAQLAVAAMARCHRAGLWQADPHLDNFMLADGTVWLVDGGSVRQASKGRARFTLLDNLALFCAQFPAADDARLESLLDAYQAAGGRLSPADRGAFAERTRRARLGRLRDYERKLFRATSSHRSIRDRHRHVVHHRSLDAGDFIAAPDAGIDRSPLLKDGNTSTVALLRQGEMQVVAKRYNIKSPGHGLLRLLQPSRASHTWRNAAMLQMLGIATPRPLLYMEQRLWWWLRRRAWLLAEKIDGVDLARRFESDPPNSPELERIAAAFQHLFRIFRDYRISHGDMKASNFIWRDGRLYVLDLDAMRRHRSERVFQRRHRRDLARFLRNWPEQDLRAVFQQAIDALNADNGD